MALTREQLKAAIDKLKADLATCQTERANLTSANADLSAQVIDLQKQLDALKNPPDPIPVRLYPTSPFWDPVPANPTLDPNSAAYVANFLQQGTWANKPQGTEFTVNDWTRPFYFAKASDPTYTVIQSNPGGGDAMLRDMTIHVPNGARPAGGDDAGAVIFQPDGMCVSMWRSHNPINGACQLAHLIDSHDDGLPGGGYGGIGQARFGPVMGQVLYDELVTAGEIPHALFMEVRNWHARQWPGITVAPGTGGYTADATAPPMGGHFYLAYSPAEIAALNVPAWKKIIVTAMAEFGLYTYDNGSSAHSLDWESGIPSILETGINKWTEWAKSVGIPGHQDSTGRTIYAVDIQSGVDWSRLRVIKPAH